MIPIPIFLPTPRSYDPPRCPYCHRILPPGNHEGLKVVSVVIGGASFFMWLMLTFLLWALPMSGQPTLVQVVQDEAHFVVSLLHRIY